MDNLPLECHKVGFFPERSLSAKQKTEMVKTNTFNRRKEDRQVVDLISFSVLDWIAGYTKAIVVFTYMIGNIVQH